METKALYFEKFNPELFRSGADFFQPSAAEVAAILKECGFSVSEAASFLGLSQKTGKRTVRRWLAGETLIPYAAWALLAYKAGYGIIFNF